jgi:low temperature requirement protein LtrA
MTLERFSKPRLQTESRLGERSVGWLELFYDLIYVAALIQVGQGLVNDVSITGAIQFVILFFLLWWAWTGTTFYMNRITADDLPHRFLVIAQMIAIGALATEVGGAFNDQSANVALAYGVVRTTLVLMYVRAWRLIPRAAGLARRYTIWFGAGATLWFISVAVPNPWRFWLWGAAILIDASRVFRRDVTGSGALQPDREHMSERYALFTIIVLGESFIKTTGAVADHGVTLDTQILGAIGLSITVALWWTYFDDVADSPIRARGSAKASAATWVYAHLPLTMGLTATGVAVEKLALGEIGQSMQSKYVALMIVSIIGVLAAISVIDAVTVNRHFAISERDRLIPRLASIVALLTLWTVGATLPAQIFGIIVLTVVAFQIGVEDALAKRREDGVRDHVARLIEENRGGTGLCEHLIDLSITSPVAGVCVECAEKGMVWVHLRSCTTCGTVGCCDDSEGQHATEHHGSTGHPVIISIEDGEDWAWCYEHEISLDLTSS